MDDVNVIIEFGRKISNLAEFSSHKHISYIGFELAQESSFLLVLFRYGLKQLFRFIHVPQ